MNRFSFERAECVVLVRSTAELLRRVDGSIIVFKTKKDASSEGWEDLIYCHELRGGLLKEVEGDYFPESSYNYISEKDVAHIPESKPMDKRKRVINTKTNTVYESIKVASKIEGINKKYLCQILIRNAQKSKYKHLKYYNDEKVSD